MAQATGQAQTQQSLDQAGAQASDNTQQQDPQWLSAIADEATRAEARKGYMQERDYTQKTQELAKERETFQTDQKSWDEGKSKVETEAAQYRDWYNQQYQPFYQKLAPHWDEINAVLEGQAKVVRNGQASVPAPTNGPNPVPPDYWNNYDMLTPQEQAVRQQEALVQYGLNPAMQQQVQGLQQAFAQQLSDRDKVYGNWAKLFTDGFTKKLANPEFPIETYMENALKVQNGQMDPMAVAYSVTMADSDRKKADEESYKRGRADAELELKNQQQSEGALGGQGTPQVFTKPQSRTRGAIETDVQGIAHKMGIPWLR